MLDIPRNKMYNLEKAADEKGKPKISKLTYKPYKPDTLNGNSGFFKASDSIREGSRIKGNILDILKSQLGELDSRHIFDGIDDDTIERNKPVAQAAIEDNIRKGLLTQEQLEKYPNMLDAMTMFYAAGEKGKPKAQNLARRVAYSVKPQNLSYVKEANDNSVNKWNKVPQEFQEHINQSNIGWHFLKPFENSSQTVTPDNTYKAITLDDNGINMLANIERNTSSVKYDSDGNITALYPTGTDNGYGHDLEVNNSQAKVLTAQEALELLKKDAQTAVDAIASIDANFTQNQFNALVSLRYNIGYLSNIDGLLEYLVAGRYNRDEMRELINGYYDKLVLKNPNNAQYINGWYTRTEKMLDIFFDGNYGEMPIDAVNVKVNK